MISVLIGFTSMLCIRNYDGRNTQKYQFEMVGRQNIKKWWFHYKSISKGVKVKYACKLGRVAISAK